MKDTRSKMRLYGAAAKRLYMWNYLSKKLQLILVTEFPKSGGSWFCQMLSEAADLPFPRNTTPKLEQCIMHGHHLFHPRMHKAIAILRDGRDVMVSAYFHFLFEHDRNPPKSVQYHRNLLRFRSYEAVEENLPTFIEYMFTVYAKKNRFHFDWCEFVKNIKSWPESVCILKYEDLLNNPVIALEQALTFHDLKVPDQEILSDIVEKYSFKNVARRDPGKEDRKSFVRKGISGDWMNYFNNDACELFKQYAGSALIEAGYERDLSWKTPIITSERI